MSDGQVGVFILVVFIVLLVSVAAQFRWLGNGKVQTVVVFISGVAVITLLRIGNIPPSWFAGKVAGFALAASLTAGAFIGRGEEKAFRLPLFLGLGLSLFAVNIAQAITNVL